MIIAGLISGTAITLSFVLPWLANKFRPSPRSSTHGQVHRSNRQLGRIGLSLLPFMILLPLNFSLTPNLIASAIAQKLFDSACDGWETSFILYGIPNPGDRGASSSGDLFSRGRLAGSLTFTGAETGSRVMYTRNANAPTDFDDKNITQTVFNERAMGQSFTTSCSAIGVEGATEDTTDCISGSALSFVMYNTASDVSMFVNEDVPVASLMFTPPATTYSGNYSNWQEAPPLGSLVDQNLKEQVKVVRKGSANACKRPIKVCARGILEGSVAMSYVWRRWQEWGMGTGGC
jgi:hypothetical protein